MSSFYAKLALFGLVAGLVAMVEAAPQTRHYQLRLQPELDSINVDDYLKNEKLVELQVQCIIYDGPCDAVGRWIKPRVAPSFVGQCPMCTEKQQNNVVKIIKHFQEKRPEAYNLAVVNFLRDAGVDLNGLSRALTAKLGSAAVAPAPVVALAAASPAPSVAALTAEPTTATTPEVGTTVAAETATV